MRTETVEVTRAGDGPALWQSEAGGRGVLLASTDRPDAVTFPADVAHSYRNDRRTPARFSLAVFEPGVGAGG